MDQGQPTPPQNWGPPPPPNPYPPQASGGWNQYPPPTPQSGSSGFSDFVFFRRMITPSIIVVLYVIGVVLITLFALLYVTSPAARFTGSGQALLTAVFGWVVGQLYLRVILEVLVVLFRLYESVRNIDRKTKD